MRRLLLPLLAVVLTLSACGSSSSTPPPSTGIAGLKTFTEEPETRHTTKHVSYDHTPPAGGQHFPGWLRCGIYDQPVPNEFAVHSEEHGAVWLTYLPGEEPGDLLRLATGNPYVLVSPYSGQPGTFMASTWGAQLSVDSASDPRLKTFVDRYAGGGQGSEKGADCIHGMLPADAEKALEKANP